MKIYDYQKFSNVYLGGSMLNKEESLIPVISKRLSSNNGIEPHPKEIERQERLKKRKKPTNRGMGMHKGDGTFNNSVLIFSGSSGFGSKSFEHFDEIFKKLNEILEKNNTHIILIRGNNDDPSYFTEGKINYSNIKTVADYSLIKFKGFNCLCIGGGISLDRKWKQTQSERLKKTLYWKDESTKFNEGELREILKDNKIACVITHVPPSFVGNDTSEYSDSKWSDSDKDIINDAINERLTIDKIYSEFVKANVKPYVWMFTGDGGANHLNNIRFVASSDFNNTFSLNDTVESVFGVSLKVGEMSKSNYKMHKDLYEESHSIQATHNQIIEPNQYQGTLDDLTELDGNAEMTAPVADGEEPTLEYGEFDEPVEVEVVGDDRNPYHVARRIFRDEHHNGNIQYELFNDRGILEFDNTVFDNPLTETATRDNAIIERALNGIANLRNGEGHG